MADKKTPLRKCLGCNEMKDKKELIRIVHNKQGEINVDLNGKLAGRGAYICKCSQCLETAIKSKRLEKAFKSQIPQEVYSRLKSEIEGLA